jgi:hypothetical protein
VAAKRLEDNLEAKARAMYVDTEVLSYVNYVITLTGKAFTADATINIPQPSALWRVKGVIRQSTEVI